MFVKTQDRKQAGDTIVEVLIAIGIASLMLVAAYVVSNKNSVALQANTERIQAQNLVESQIEALRASNGLPAGMSCFNGSTPSSTCNNFTQAGSGATYTVKISGPTSNVYTVSAKWTGLEDNASNGSNVTMVYRLQ